MQEHTTVTLKTSWKNAEGGGAQVHHICETPDKNFRTKQMFGHIYFKATVCKIPLFLIFFKLKIYLYLYTRIHLSRNFVFIIRIFSRRISYYHRLIFFSKSSSPIKFIFKSLLFHKGTLVNELKSITLTSLMGEFKCSPICHQTLYVTHQKL